MFHMLPLLVFFVFLPGWICAFLIVARKNISCMAGMMSAMTVGMGAGLGMGAIASIVFPINTFYAIMFGMLAGSFAGITAGLPISLMAVLDGMLSGLMAGMMGAMLVDMISSNYHMILLQVLAILTGGIVFVLYLMLQSEIKQKILSGLPLFLRKPSWMFTVILLSGIGLQQVNVLQSAPKSLTDLGIEQHSGHGSQESVPSPSPSIQQVHIQASEFAYSPKTVQIRASDTVKVILHNAGKVEHDFVIQSENVHIHAQPGKQSSRIIRIANPGIYQVICTIPGHREAGMTLNVEVT
jgi:plastocyanin